MKILCVNSSPRIPGQSKTELILNPLVKGIIKCIIKFLCFSFRRFSSTLTLSLLLFIYSYPISLYAQECIGSYTLTSQTEIDVFNCTSVTGNLYIEETVYRNITNLNGLSKLTSVGGSFRIWGNDALTNVDGLAALTSVGRDFFIKLNSALTNVDGLAALTSFGGDIFSISNNDALTNVDGLAALTSLGGSLFITLNDALINVDGLAAIASVGGRLDIWGNPALTNVDGLANLTSVGELLNIGSNPALTNVDGLANLTSIGRSLLIQNNDALTNVDGLAALTSVGIELVIYGNPALTNVDGLASLTSVIEDNLYIGSNPALTNVDGLAALTSVGGSLWVNNNDALMRCCGLYPLLTSGTIGGEIRILNNITGCNSADEIINAGPCIYEILIDIKPGGYPNSINLKSKGNVPVAILTTDDFDAYNVDPDYCEFAGAYPLRWNMEDVDYDGDYDMLFHFKTQELELTKESTEASLEGETYDGQTIVGTDSVKIVPNAKYDKISLNNTRNLNLDGSGEGSNNTCFISALF